MKRLIPILALALVLCVAADAFACPLLGRVFGAAKSGLGRTRFFDGDGRPLLRADRGAGRGRLFDGDGRPFRRAN